jgi:dTDP-4-dehydrorhamnose 3,5-epimerase
LLPRNCRLLPLSTLADNRGDLTEVFREEWFGSPPPRVWRVVRGSANALAGVRVCAENWTYLSLLDGDIVAGLVDLRPPAAGAARSAQFALSDKPRQVLAVAPGVAHGFYFSRPALYLLGRTERIDPADRLLCAWDSPDLGIAWPCVAPVLSASDRDGAGYAEFRSHFRALAKKPDPE